MNHAQNITKLLGSASYRYDRYSMFSDCMSAMACSISNSVDVAHREKREARYMEIVGRYKEDLSVIRETFPRVMAEVASALEEDPQDILGQTFHEMELHNKDRGQAFTPYELSLAMAKMTVGNGDGARQIIEQRGFVTAHEPAVGAGSTVIALAEAFKDEGINYQQHLHVTAVDIDERAAHMAYVQFSLMHIPAAVYVGDTLKMEMRDVWYTPAHVMGLWSYKLKARQAVDAAKSLESAEIAEAVEEKPPAPRHDIEAGQFVQQGLFEAEGGSSIKPLGLGLRMPEARFEPKPLSRCHSSARCPSCLHRRVVQRCRVRGVDRQVRTSPTHRRCPHIRSIRRS